MTDFASAARNCLFDTSHLAKAETAERAEWDEIDEGRRMIEAIMAGVGTTEELEEIRHYVIVLMANIGLDLAQFSFWTSLVIVAVTIRESSRTSWSMPRRPAREGRGAHVVVTLMIDGSSAAGDNGMVMRQ